MNSTNVATKSKDEIVAKMMEMAAGQPAEKQSNAIKVMKKASNVGDKVFAAIPIDMLRIDTEYQRPTSSHLKTLIRDWDETKCAPITVNYRKDGYFYIIDGQHRCEAGKANGLKEMVCCISAGMTVEEEANLFASQGAGMKKPSQYDIFKANVKAKDTVDCRINAICQSYGVVVEKSIRSNALSCITLARKIVTNSADMNKKEISDAGCEYFRTIMEVLNKCKWGHRYPKAYCHSVVMSVYRVLKAYEDTQEYAIKLMIKLMQEISPEELLSFGNVMYPQYRGAETRAIAVLDDLVKGTFTTAEIEKRLGATA